MLKSHALAAALCAAVLTATSFAADFCLTLDPNGAQASKLCSVYPGAPEPKVENAMYSLASLKIGDTVTFLTPQGELKGSVTYAVKDVNGIVCRAGNLDDFAGQWRIAAGPNVLYGVVEDLKADVLYEINGTKSQGVYSVKECSFSERCAELTCPEEVPVWEENSLMGARVMDLTPEQAAWAANWDDDEEVELTIAVVFSPLAVEEAGSLEAANAKVASGMAYGNQAMQNSQIHAKLTCVGTYLSDYEETKDSSLDLGRFSSGIDGFEFVPALRNKLGADFMCYCPKYMTPGWAGLGYVHGSPTGSEGSAYHVVLLSYIGGTSYSWIHEWGHNMGCNHSHEQSGSSGPEDGGLFGHSLGCYFYATNLTQRCCSIMTYQGSWDGQYWGYRVPYFSEQFLNYGGSAVYYNSKTRNATTWQKIRKYASLYRTPPVLSEFNTGFEADEDYRLGDATWQQGLISLNATGQIKESSGNYYLHSQGGNGFQQPVNVKSDNGFGTYKVSIRVNPTFGGTYFDIRGAKDALCYVYVTSSGSLNLACSSTPGGTVSKATALQQISTGWQEWTFFIEESTKTFLGWAVNGEYHAATDCYVAGEDDVYVSSVWMKDVSSSGADFDDLHVDCGIGDLALSAEPMAIGSNMTTIKLSNLNENTTIKYKAKVVVGGDNFTISPVEGLFKDEAEIRVEAHDLPTTPQFLECVVEVDAGNAGKKRIRLGAPCGNETDGYGLYSADLSTFPKGSPSDYDSCWENSGTLDYAFDHYVTDVLLDEDFEDYPGNTNMGGIGGWGSGYGTIDKDGSIYVRERFGNKYCEVAFINPYFGAHKKLEKQMKPHWWEGHTKGYFRVSFDAMLTGTSSKFFGLWDPQMVEGNFEYVSGNGYRFRSNASDANHSEFVSQNYIPMATWSRVSMIIEAVPVLDASGEHYRHILRQYKVDGKTENCKAFLDQDSNNDCFNTLRFFLWGSGTFCLDNLKVETIVSETDYDTLDFPDEDPMDLYFNARQDVEVKLGFTEEMAKKYDITIAAKMMLPTDFGGKLTFGQDDFHKQFATEFQLKSGQVSLTYPNVKGVRDTFTANAGEWFVYGYDISTTEKNLRQLLWDGTFHKENLPITGADSTTAIDKIKFSVSSGQARIAAVDAKLTPRTASQPIVAFNYYPITLAEPTGVICLTNELKGTTGEFTVSFKDGSNFKAEPAAGTLDRYQEIRVTAKDLPNKAAYVTDEMTVTCGDFTKTIRVGSPAGNASEGYTLYRASFYEFPQGDPRGYDFAVTGGSDVAVEVENVSKWTVKDTLLNETFEGYAADTDLCGEDGWSVAYGAVDVNGTAIVKEEDGNKYLKIKDISSLFGVHKKLTTVPSDDWTSNLDGKKGFFRVSFKVRLGGTSAKNLGLWTPQCVETQFRYDNGVYRFASNKSDSAHDEYVSLKTMAPEKWVSFSAVFSAESVNDDGGEPRHILRSVTIDGAHESGQYLCDQANTTTIFDNLRFFQWGEGYLDIDDILVETIVAEDKDGKETFAEDLIANISKLEQTAGGLFCEVGLPEGMADAYDLVVYYSLGVPKGALQGDVILSQDEEHRQLEARISPDGEDKLKLSFTDCPSASALVTKETLVDQMNATAFKFNTKTGKKELKSFIWGTQIASLEEAITGSEVKETEAVDKVRIDLSNAGDQVKVKSVLVTLSPTAIPEPTTLLLLALLSLAILRRK